MPGGYHPLAPPVIYLHQLHGAWRAAGLDAAPRADGGLTFCCPACAVPTRLEVDDGVALCPCCSWGETGEPWSVATAAAQAKAARLAQSTDPALWEHLTLAKNPTLVERLALAGHTALSAKGLLTATASPSQPNDPTHPGAAPAQRGLPTWTLDEILAYEPDPTEEIWPGGIFSQREPAALIGAPGVGKSRLALQAAICTLLGWKFLGWPTRGERLKWLFLQTENSARRLKADLSAMTRHLPDDAKDALRQGLRILNVTAMDFATICMADGHPDKTRILETLEAWSPDVVVIDPLRDAGRGDPNKDQDMTETCQGIGQTLWKTNPRRAPLIIHHGRTGASEASKVFGDDAASFGRNSKVLHGWLRSQINIAPAGIDHPDTVIFGCGKNSNGPKWEPFAARLQPDTMTYRRLEPTEFDLAAWAEGMGASGSSRNKAKRKTLPTPEEVATVVAKAGGEVRGGIRAEDGLVERVRRQFGITRADAESAIDSAVGQTIETHEQPGASFKGGGKPGRIYVLQFRHQIWKKEPLK